MQVAMAIEGPNITLREERAEDLPLLVALRNDLETQAWGLALPPDFTLEMYRKRFQAREFSYARTDGRFIMVHKGSGEAIGYISYTGLVPRWEVTIGIMLSRAYWGQGLAFEAQELLLQFLFEELGVRVVRLWTHSANDGAVRLAERSGFQVAVRRRGSVYKSGQLSDGLMMDLLRTEYYTRHPELTDRLPDLARPPTVS
jgi:ribosomal-protein-alanine N-acetyltransferase